MEYWKGIKGYEGKYQIGRNQKVRSLVGGKIRILSTHVNNHGYRYVCLSKNNKRKAKRIGRLMALSFVPNPKNYETVNHKNGNKLDDRIRNLEWCSRIDNVLHAYANGLVPPPRMEKQKHPVVQLTQSGKVISKHESINAAAKNTGVSAGAIWKFVSGYTRPNKGGKPRRKRAGGFIWKYAS